MNDLSKLSVSPTEFFKMFKYYLPYDFKEGDNLSFHSYTIFNFNRDGKTSSFNFNRDGKTSRNILDFRPTLRYKKFGLPYPYFITLENMMGSSIAGVPFYEYQLKSKKLNWFVIPLSCDIWKVTPLPNIITGQSLTYPVYMYNGYEIFKKNTEQFQKITRDDFLKLYNSGFDMKKFKEDSYYKSIDFCHSGPFIFGEYLGYNFTRWGKYHIKP